jgi:hypothetical protein
LNRHGAEVADLADQGAPIRQDFATAAYQAIDG